MMKKKKLTGLPRVRNNFPMPKVKPPKEPSSYDGGFYEKFLHEEAPTEAYTPREWGGFKVLDELPRFKVKKLIIKPGKQISLQRHHHRSEYWVVVAGTAEIIKNNEIIFLTESQAVHIPVNTVHRVFNPGKIDLEIIEVQTGAYLEEDDIIRLEDDYGRKWN